MQFDEHGNYIVGTSAPYIPPRLGLITTAGLADIPPAQPLIDGMLSLDNLAWLAGAPGSYKSFMAIDWAMCVSTGVPYMGHPVTHVPTVYVTGEGKSGLRERVEAWKRGQPPADKGWWYPQTVHVLSDDWRLLIQACQDVEAKLIVLDTQSNMTAGMDENSAKDMSTWVMRLQDLQAATGACVLVLHHSSKGGESLRGSSVLHGAADSVYAMERLNPEPFSEARVWNPKQKDMPQAKEWYVRPVVTAGSVVLTECEKPNSQRTP